MKFDYIIGNPPYQGENHYQIYPDFYQSSKKVGDCVQLIFPTGWQEPKNANNLKKMNNKETKEDHQIVCIDNRHNVFSDNVTGAEWTNIIIWKKGYNNGLNGKQKILIDGKNPEIKKLLWDKSQIEIDSLLKNILNKVLSHSEFESLTNIIYIQNNLDLNEVYKYYPDAVNVVGSNGKDKRFEKNIFQKINAFTVKKEKDSNIRTIGMINNKREWRYIDEKYVDKKHANLYKYKLLVSVAAPKEFGSRLSEFVVAKPGEAYTRSFISFGASDRMLEIKNIAKYLKTKFARALLYTLKFGRMNNKDVWANIPLQDFSENSDIEWIKTIHEIDLQLYVKYGLSKDEIEFIETHVKEME